ncbi:integrase core domain-containing protein [Microbacterium laevaniformans]
MDIELLHIDDCPSWVDTRCRLEAALRATGFGDTPIRLRVVTTGEEAARLTATSMTTPLVLDCLDMALFTRRREGVTGFAGLTHHTDAGSVYTSIAFTDRLVDEGIDPSVGSVGDAYDNSLAESQIGLYKSELIHHDGPWRDIDQVEAATASWVLWFNTERTHGSIDDLTPLEVEQLDYARNEPVGKAG